ncbi:redoxin domain-containing protein [Algoriphagus sp.]|uniref:thioredoxin-like domain-containing protein n=1 Tax=Algoriphagus sp. TaxID=1872435 RepID=UPI0025E48671|nr:redoxin domain-containing protein [Algoriphagus sp.]
MKKISLILFLLFSLGFYSQAQSIGELVLNDAVTGKSFTISQELKGKAIVLIFHSIGCPFAKLYEERIIDLRSRFQNQGVSFALVNPDLGSENQNADEMRNHVDQTDLNMPYLMDINQEWVKLFHITKIPEVVILIPSENGIESVFRGAIDNNAQAAGSVTEKFLERAINQVLKGQKPSPEQVRAVGCNVRSF